MIAFVRDCILTYLLLLSTICDPEKWVTKKIQIGDFVGYNKSLLDTIYLVHMVFQLQNVLVIRSWTEFYIDSISLSNTRVDKCTVHCVWDPTKKGQWALRVYSKAIFVASWLKWIQMSLYVSNKSTEFIWFN